MLKKSQILKLFEQLNKKLKEKGEKAEVGLVGGTVMCLVFNAREATQDVDAIFEPTKVVRQLAAQVGEELGVGSHWLNDAAKGFLQSRFERQDVLNLSHLRVWAPVPEYMLAMKCISARWDTHDRDDVIFLIKYLKLKSAKSVFEIIENYYPKKQIPAKTQFLIQEVLGGSST